VRYLAWLLLVANLGVLVWLINQPVQQPPAYRPIPVPPGVEPLLLLSERSSKTESAESQPPAQQNPEPENQGVADDRPLVNGRQAAEIEPEIRLICQTVGPLMVEADARAIAAQLSGRGYAPHTRTGEVREASGYWVYMPAMQAREARRIVAELDANGMKDYFIGKQNYISLGIFSLKDKAQARLEQVRALGFEAILDKRYRTRKVYWLDIEKRAKPLPGSDLWVQIQAQHADIRAQRVSCD